MFKLFKIVGFVNLDAIYENISAGDPVLAVRFAVSNDHDAGAGDRGKGVFVNIGGPGGSQVLFRAEYGASQNGRSGY